LKIFFLVILITFCFGSSQSKACEPRCQLVGTSVREKQSANFESQPFNLFELTQLSLATANRYRQQSQDMVFDNHSRQCAGQRHYSYRLDESSWEAALKNYLSHIYPSHNFW
jgi:hypothetical protein